VEELRACLARDLSEEELKTVAGGQLKAYHGCRA
jgi:hypothetical protein